MMKGIILAGGSGTRLHPVTRVLSKQLLPIYDKPMIYYPLATLMLAGIREVLVISTPHDLPRFEELLGDGSDLGMEFHYVVQERPEGLAQAFVLGRDFIGSDPVSLVLGDNLFFGHGFSEVLGRVATDLDGATIFGYWVKDPKAYGVVDFDDEGRVLDIQEKPERPKSHYAVPGLYFYDNDVVDFAADLRPSPRGELEITDLNRVYLHQKRLRVELLGRGYAWLDTGTPLSLHQAASYVETLQERQGLRVACIEEIAHKMGYIDDRQLYQLAQRCIKSSYGQYLMELLEEPSPGPGGSRGGRKTKDEDSSRSPAPI